MTRAEEVEFCKKRIIEQNEYIFETVNKKMTFGRRRDLITCAIIVRKRFQKRLMELVGMFGYVYFKLYEE